jgi:outer membrane protein assembly factor BamB
VVSQGVLYLGTQEGKIIALNAQTGNRDLPWVEIEGKGGGGMSFACSSGSSGAALYSTPVVSSDMFYVGDYNGNMYALTLKLGAGWGGKRFETKGNLIGNPVLADGYLYFGASDKKLYALNASTGQPKEGWPFKTKGKIWSTPTVADGVVYIGTLDHHIYAIQADTGKEIPGFNFEADGAIMTAPIVQGDTIYVGANDHYLYALNKADGSVKWKFKGSSWFWAQPAISGNTIYAVSLNGKLYAIKDIGNTYEPLWQYDLKAAVNAPLLLVKVDDQELLFVGDHDNYLNALNTDETLPDNKPRLKWSIKFKSPVYAPLCFNEDNSYVYVYTRNHELRALDAVAGAPKWTFDTHEMALMFR